MKILLVEDEQSLSEIISNSLKKESYQVDTSFDGEEAYLLAKSNIYDLIILDVMLPSMDGFEILKRLRKENINTKIIMLTARSSLDDKLAGLNNGANDYLTKPFHIEELIARVNIQLNTTKSIIKYADLSLNTSTSILSSNNKSVELVCKEFKLLEYFMNNPDIILDKEQIYERVWGIESTTESNNLEAYLSFIRRKLKAIDSKVNIKSIRGLGYKIEVTNEKSKK